MLIELPPWANYLNISKTGIVILSDITLESINRSKFVQLGKVRTTTFFKPTKNNRYCTIKLTPIQDGIIRFLDEQMRVVADFDKPYKQYVLEKLLSRGE